MIQALIVDDEAPARNRLRRLLETESEINIIGEASHGVEALRQIETLKPQVVFLDIEMPELDGLGVARSLDQNGPAIIFVTAYDEFALKAFDANAIDYLVKPVASARLKSALQKLRSRNASVDDLSRILTDLERNKPNSKLAVKSGTRYVVIDLSRVSAILAKDHYSAIQVDGRELLTDDSLEVYEKKLDPNKFVRVHRSAIVNLDFIHELERDGDRKFTAVLSDHSKNRVAISRERLDEVKKRLGL